MTFPLNATVVPADNSRTLVTIATYNEIDWIVVSMQQANRNSWRALERVGFKRRWAGLLDSPDPSDAGPTFVYVRHRDW